RDSHALGVATFLSAERLGYPPGKPQRERLLSRVDALLATSPEAAAAAAERLPGDYRIIFPGVDAELFRPAEEHKRIVLEWRPTERQLARSVLRELRELPEWELVLLRTTHCASAKAGRTDSGPKARPSPGSRASTMRFTASSRNGGAPPAMTILSRGENGSSAICTCTRRGRTTARSRFWTCSRTPRPKGSA